MAQHIDITYVDAFVEQTTRIGFTGGTAGTDAVLVQMIEAASAIVDVLAFSIGYTIPDPITGITGASLNYLKLATFGAMLAIMYGRKGLEVPDTYQAAIDAHQRLVEAAAVDPRSGRNTSQVTLDLPGVPLNVTTATGGIIKPDTTVSTSNQNAKENVFSHMRSLY